MSPDTRKASYGTPEYARNPLEKGKTPNIIAAFCSYLFTYNIPFLVAHAPLVTLPGLILPTGP